MTTPFLQGDVRFFEGEPATHAPALAAYPDPGGVYTIGFGHTGPDVYEGLSCTVAEAVAWLAHDIAHAEHELDLNLPWWRTLNDPRQDVLVQMCFNLGIGGLLEFHHMLADCQLSDWNGAAAEMLASEWSVQVGNRAKVLSKTMLTGVRVPPETVL